MATELQIINNSYDNNLLLKEAVDNFVDPSWNSDDPIIRNSYIETMMHDGEDLLAHKRRLAQDLDRHVVTRYPLTNADRSLPDIEQVKQSFGNLLIAWKDKSPHGYINVYVPRHKLAEARVIEKSLGLSEAYM